MGVTFNLVDQGVTRTGVYGHIVEVLGPRKNPEINDGTDGHWYIGYRLVIHENQSARDSDNDAWDNRIPTRYVNQFSWTGPNLSTYPTMAVLYADLKTDLAAIRVGGSAIVNTIADAV